MRRSRLVAASTPGRVVYLSRKPVEALRPSITSLWYSNRQLVTQAREFALPTGSSPTFAKVSLRGAFGRLSIGVWRIYFLDERSVGIQRSRSKALTALRWSAVKTGASITVAGRLGPFVPTRTKVAFISASVFIVPLADFRFTSVRRARLTSIKPITVAKAPRIRPRPSWPGGTIPPHSTGPGKRIRCARCSRRDGRYTTPSGPGGCARASAAVPDRRANSA